MHFLNNAENLQICNYYLKNDALIEYNYYCKNNYKKGDAKMIKKVIATVISLCFVIGAASTVFASAAPSADVNKDSNSTAADLLALEQHILNIQTISSYNYDVNDDAVVDSSDLVTLQAHLLGISVIEEVEEPVEDPLDPGIEDASDVL